MRDSTSLPSPPWARMWCVGGDSPGSTKTKMKSSCLRLADLMASTMALPIGARGFWLQIPASISAVQAKER